jgi:para-nitrobenzyl esterase
VLAEEFGDRAQEIIGAYQRDYPEATLFDLYATIAALGAAPAYSYVYCWRTPALDGRPGPFHAAELAFTFDNAEVCDHYSGGTPEAFLLSKQISRAWVAFARTGNPNHDGLPHWPIYTAEHKATMYFDKPCTVRNDPEGEGLRLITQS